VYFEVDPNSDASELLELDEHTKNNPDWFTDKLMQYLQNDEEQEFSDWWN